MLARRAGEDMASGEVIDLGDFDLDNMSRLARHVHPVEPKALQARLVGEVQAGGTAVPDRGAAVPDEPRRTPIEACISWMGIADDITTRLPA